MEFPMVSWSVFGLCPEGPRCKLSSVGCNVRAGLSWNTYLQTVTLSDKNWRFKILSSQKKKKNTKCSLLLLFNFLMFCVLPEPLKQSQSKRTTRCWVVLGQVSFEQQFIVDWMHLVSPVFSWLPLSSLALYSKSVLILLLLGVFRGRTSVVSCKLSAFFTFLKIVTIIVYPHHFSLL